MSTAENKSYAPFPIRAYRQALAVIRKFEHNHVFSQDESWMLFRLAAIGEAVGWTLLIAGIATERYILPGNGVPVLLAGRTHGILFMLYMLAAVGLYPTLRWPRKVAFVALLASVPPYGSIIFEQAAQYVRRRARLTAYQYYMVLAALDK